MAGTKIGRKASKSKGGTRTGCGKKKGETRPSVPTPQMTAVNGKYNQGAIPDQRGGRFAKRTEQSNAQDVSRASKQRRVDGGVSAAVDTTSAAGGEALGMTDRLGVGELTGQSTSTGCATNDKKNNSSEDNINESQGAAGGEEKIAAATGEMKTGEKQTTTLDDRDSESETEGDDFTKAKKGKVSQLCYGFGANDHGS